MDNYTHLQDAVKNYSKHNIDAIPIYQEDKRPFGINWPNRSVDNLWQGAKDKPNMGVGVRFGSHDLAGIDLDEKNQLGTVETGLRWLEALGLKPGDFPYIQTSSGIGRLILVRFGGGLIGDYRKFKPDFGAGEFRYGAGAFSVAPPSVVGKGIYKLLNGSYENIPTLSYEDILPILGKAIHSETKNCSDKAKKLMGGDWTGYQSRSDGDAALILSLIGSDYTFDEIMSVFERYPTSGKFNELLATRGRTEALRYLHRTYDNELAYHNQNISDMRSKYLDLHELYSKYPEAGRGGVTKKNVFLSHLEVGFRTGKPVYGFSAREGAEMSGSSFPTVARANKTLLEERYISLATGTYGEFPNTYSVNFEYVTEKIESVISDTITIPPLVNDCISYDTHEIKSHDVFRNTRGLGKVAGQIYEMLMGKSLTVSEICKATGRCRNSIKINLKRMSTITDYMTGEIFWLVQQNEDKTWARNPDADLDKIAEFIGVAGYGERQKALHQRDRRRFRESYWKKFGK